MQATGQPPVRSVTGLERKDRGGMSILVQEDVGNAEPKWLVVRPTYISRSKAQEVQAFDGL